MSFGRLPSLCKAISSQRGGGGADVKTFIPGDPCRESIYRNNLCYAHYCRWHDGKNVRMQSGHQLPKKFDRA